MHESARILSKPRAMLLCLSVRNSYHVISKLKRSKISFLSNVPAISETALVSLKIPSLRSLFLQNMNTIKMTMTVGN